MIDYRNGGYAFNTDVMMLGGEIEGEILLKDMFRLGAGVSYVYGKNLKNTNGLKDGDALPLILPLIFKAKVGLEQPNWFISAGYKYKNYQFIVAAENLNDKLYSYHTSKSDLGTIPGYDFSPTQRVYEPGRSF